jgi:hypothetical protein
MIQMHHAPHVLYNCRHTNKIGVKHTENCLMLCIQNIWSLEGRLEYSSSLYRKKTSHPFSKYGARIHILNNDTSYISNTVVTSLVLWQGRNNTLWSTQYFGSKDSSVSTVTTVGSRGPIPGRSKSSVLQSTKISPKDHWASYSMNIRGSFPWD